MVRCDRLSESLDVAPNRAGLRRRTILKGGVGLSASLISLPSRAAEFTGRQFHNQPEDSHLHGFLTDLWRAVDEQTGGRLNIATFAQNAGVSGSDPEVLRMTASGDLEFFTIMGGILGQVVPVAEIQGVPFAFKSHQQVFAAMDGRFGAYLGREMAAKGLFALPRGCLQNGFRQMSTIAKPIHTPKDLEGLRIRVPDGQMFREVFAALGAEPRTVNIRELYGALRDRSVDGQENPLVVTEVNKLYEVTKYVSLTNHMWSGFNLIANGTFWHRLPDELRTVVERNVVAFAAKQRAYTNAWNEALSVALVKRGMVFNQTDSAPFRAPLAPHYARWKREFGAKAWELLEDAVGSLA